MGMFDSFYGYWRCPDCNVSDEIEVQTKELECLLTRYHTGMAVENLNRSPDDSYIIEETYWCPHCSQEPHVDPESGHTWRRLKDKWKEWKVNIVIEKGIYKELVFTGESRIVDTTKLPSYEDLLSESLLYREEEE